MKSKLIDALLIVWAVLILAGLIIGSMMHMEHVGIFTAEFWRNLS